jgi:hypothetical protein
VKEWDDFLAEALTLPSNWSTLAFTVSGNSEGVEDVRAIGYGPERLVDLRDEAVTYVGIAEKSTRPVELVVRIDRTQASRGPRSFQVFGSIEQTDAHSTTNGSARVPEMASRAGSPETPQNGMSQEYLA